MGSRSSRQLWLGGSFQRSLIGVTNSAESLTYSARCWSLLILNVARDSTSGVEMTFSNKQKCMCELSATGQTPD